MFNAPIIFHRSEEEPPVNMPQETAKLIVTSAGLDRPRYTRFALRAALPKAQIRQTGLRGIFALEAEGDVFEVAKIICRECGQRIGHITAVLAEVESSVEPIKEAAVRIGRGQIGIEESFCFRIHKRGAHFLQQDTLTIEQEIGGAIWTALAEKHGTKPRVWLKHPDATIVAEVLGPTTAVGISRRLWRQQPGP
jgi:tRNA(Ser,Leu) C12 N-acetylase TAN1